MYICLVSLFISVTTPSGEGRAVLKIELPGEWLVRVAGVEGSNRAFTVILFVNICA